MTPALDRLYAARRAALEAEAALLDVEDERDLVALVAAAVEEARALGDDSARRAEASFRLQVLADVLAKVQHRGAAALLVRVLGDADPSVRARAAAALGALATGRWPELVRAIEEALDEELEGPALLVLPGLLLDLSDDDRPVPLDLLVRFLDHDDADVAAEAACALAELDVPGVRELLESFAGDERRLSDALDGSETLGGLVVELLETLALEDDVESRKAEA